MSRRLTCAILRLYPRRVRQRHGPEIMALIDDLIAHDGRSRAGLLIHLAVDGLGQRIASTATVWTMVAVLAATSVGVWLSRISLTPARTKMCRARYAPSRRRGTPTRHRTTSPDGAAVYAGLG